LRNNLGQTPMYVASVSKHYDIIRLLKKTWKLNAKLFPKGQMVTRS
jgi:hypothetical protein